MAHTKDMRIDSHRRTPEGNGLDDIGRLAPNAGQAQQCIHIGRHLAPMLLNEHTRKFYKMGRFGIGIGNALHILKNFVGLNLRH